jgi:signal transduction histidine kinase
MLRRHTRAGLPAPAARLFLVFGLAIVVPAAALLAVGWRTLAQDRRNAELEARAQLDTQAGRAATALDQEFAQWQTMLGGVAHPCPATIDTVPADLRTAVEQPGSAVIVCVERDAVLAIPTRAVLFRLQAASQEEALAITPTPLREAERVELVQENYAAAASKYERLLGETSGAARAPVLLRLARTLDKAHQFAAAARTYSELEGIGDVRVGAVPASLVGRERTCDLLSRQSNSRAAAECATHLYDDLLASRWHLDEARYTHYAAQARTWMNRSASAATRDARKEQIETNKYAITTAAAWAVSERLRAGARASSILPQVTAEGRALVFSNGATEDSERFLVVSVSHLAAERWPRVFGEASLAGLWVSIVAPGGEGVFSTAPASAMPRDSIVSTASVRDSGWHVQVALRDPYRAAFGAERRRAVYVAMLALMALSLAFGATLAVVTVRRERAVSQLQSQFVSTVSHEFRSPLTAIRQLVELLARGRVADENRQEYYDTLLRESHRLSRLVENVLDFSRMEDRRWPYRIESTDTSPFLRDVAGSFQASPASTGATVVVKIPDDLPRIKTDRDALARALRNLLDNAVKYSTTPATVEFEASRCEGGVRIQVRDRGLGIPAEDVSRIFDRFYRGRGTSATVKGTGLGLSIVKHVVEAHGAHIDVQSTPGQGTTMTLTVAAADLEM